MPNLQILLQLAAGPISPMWPECWLCLLSALNTPVKGGCHSGVLPLQGRRTSQSRSQCMARLCAGMAQSFTTSQTPMRITYT